MKKYGFLIKCDCKWFCVCWVLVICIVYRLLIKKSRYNNNLFDWKVIKIVFVIDGFCDCILKYFNFVVDISNFNFWVLCKWKLF